MGCYRSEGRSAAAALAAVLFLATPANAFNFFTFPDSKCTQPGGANVFDGVYGACTPLSGPPGGSITASASGLVQHWASGSCSGTSSQVQVSATCSAFFGQYARLVTSLPSPSPSPAPSGGGSSGFYAFLLVPAVLALIAARCFCCPLDRRVTGLPVRSRRHRHDLRYTVSADECGDCLNSLNKSSNSSTDGQGSGYTQVGSGPVYTFKDLRCAACGQQTRRSYTCSECEDYCECEGCFQAVGGGAAAAGHSAPPSAKRATMLPASAPPSAAGGTAPLLDNPSDPCDPAY